MQFLHIHRFPVERRNPADSSQCNARVLWVTQNYMDLVNTRLLYIYMLIIKVTWRVPTSEQRQATTEATSLPR